MANLNDLEKRLLESPSARARFLGEALELLERQGVDTTAEQFAGAIRANLENGPAFLQSLAASTIVIAIAAGRGATPPGGATQATLLAVANAIGGRGGASASTVVIAIASAGGRAVTPGGIGGLAASTVVIALASAGGRAVTPGGGGGLAASTVVIAIASAGGRAITPGGAGGLAASTVVIAIASGGGRAITPGGGGLAASTVVIAIASAGGRNLGDTLGRIESTAGSGVSMNEIGAALRQLADLLDAKQVEINQGGGGNAELSAAAAELVAIATQMTGSATEMVAGAEEMAKGATEMTNAAQIAKDPNQEA